MAASNSTFSPQAVGTPLAQRASNAWRWWKGELGAVTPQWLHTIISPPQELANIYLDGRNLSTLKLGVNSATPTNTVSLDEGDAALRRLSASVRAEAGNVSALRLVLPQAEVLRRRISLPLATEENLRQVVGFDLDRQTPFNAASAYYDVKIESRDTATAMLNAQLAATPKAEIEAVISTLAKAGLTVRAIGVVDDLAGANPHFDLFPPELRPEHKLTKLQIFNRVLMGLVTVLTLAVVFVPVWQKRENVLSLLPILEQAKIDNEGTERVLTEVTRLATEYNLIATKKQTTQTTTGLIEEFSKILPDNTWVQSLEIKTTPKVREVQVQGETASATKLIELFEKSPLLQNTSTRSQVSRGSMPNTERYHIAAEVKPRAIMDEKTAMAQGLVTANTGSIAAVNAPAAVSAMGPMMGPVLGPAAPDAKSAPSMGKNGSSTPQDRVSPRKSDATKGVPVPTYVPNVLPAPNRAAAPAAPIATPLAPDVSNGRPVPSIPPPGKTPVSALPMHSVLVAIADATSVTRGAL